MSSNPVIKICDIEPRLGMRVVEPETGDKGTIAFIGLATDDDKAQWPDIRYIDIVIGINLDEGTHYRAPHSIITYTLDNTYETHGLDTQAQVFFYEQDFYVLSNFSAFTLQWRGLRFDTSEAAYHWEKFPGKADIRNEILQASSAHAAFKIARLHDVDKSIDWDLRKVSIMRAILWEKVLQHGYVAKKLLATGNRELVENSWRDSFWGWGEDQNGQNQLGRLWMEIRQEILLAGHVRDAYHTYRRSNKRID